MSEAPAGFYANITLTDVQLASAYYPILIEAAKHQRVLTYGDLVDFAKVMYPDRDYVQNAIAVSTGRRLDVVRMFTREMELPDLTSLVVNKGSGECGSVFTRNFDPVAKRAEVFAFDWSGVKSEFEGFLKTTEAALAPRKRLKELKETQARELMFDYYQCNKATLDPAIREHREAIVSLIMEGLPPREAFERVLQA